MARTFYFDVRQGKEAGAYLFEVDGRFYREDPVETFRVIAKSEVDVRRFILKTDLRGEDFKSKTCSIRFLRIA